MSLYLYHIHFLSWSFSFLPTTLVTSALPSTKQNKTTKPNQNNQSPILFILLYMYSLGCCWTLSGLPPDGTKPFPSGIPTGYPLLWRVTNIPLQCYLRVLSNGFLSKLWLWFFCVWEESWGGGRDWHRSLPCPSSQLSVIINISVKVAHLYLMD